MSQIGNIGIVGAGKMGEDIFNYLIEYNLSVKLYCHGEEEFQRHTKLFDKRLKRKLKHGLIDENDYNGLLKNISFSSSLDDFSDVDLIIETVPENIELKSEVFSRLDEICKPRTIFTSNSSSYLPSIIKDRSGIKRNILGMHFFYPLALKETVEVISEDENRTGDKAVLSDFLEKIGKKVFYQNKNTAFLLNRFYLDYQSDCFTYAMTNHYSLVELDKIVKETVSPAGVFEFMDHVGLDIMLKSILNYQEFTEPNDKYKELAGFLEKCIAKGYCGKKSGKGILDYFIELYDKKTVSIDKRIVKDNLTDRFTRILADFRSVYMPDKQLFRIFIEDYLEIRIDF